MRLSFKYILITFLLASCELVVDVKVPYGKDKIVVNDVQSYDSVWTVELTSSRYILDPGYTFEPLESAQVAITKPDGSTEPLQYAGAGRYKGVTYPVPGQTYRLHVSSNGFDDTEGQVTMPTIVPIVDMQLDSTGVQLPQGSSGVSSIALSFSVTFQDPPGEKNFYAVEFFRVIAYQRYEPGTGQPKVDSTGRPVMDTVYSATVAKIKDVGIASEDDSRQWFTDETFDGKMYTLPLATSFYSFDNYQVVGFDIRFASISEEYYKYLDTRALSFETSGDPFAQPVSVYSNLSNGFGIFGGADYQVRRYRKH